MPLSGFVRAGEAAHGIPMKRGSFIVFQSGQDELNRARWIGLQPFNQRIDTHRRRRMIGRSAVVRITVSFLFLRTSGRWFIELAKRFRTSTSTAFEPSAIQMHSKGD